MTKRKNENGNQAEFPRHLKPWTVRLCETVYDITLNAQHMLETKEIEVDDSRDLYYTILQLAIEFEREHPGPWEDGEYPTDYIDLIDEYASEKLTEFYRKEI